MRFLEIKRIGIILETQGDAVATGAPNLDLLYHWREPEEMAVIQEAVGSLGFEPVIMGPPAKVCSGGRILKQEVDFILNLSVGFRSRFRLALGPAFYELQGIPYSGADPYTKMVSQNKHLMKAFWDKLGIPTPAWVYLHNLADFSKVQFPPFPLMVKPAYEGSSIGVPASAVVNNRTDLEDRVRALFAQLELPVLVEQFIPGREMKVGVLGNDEKSFLGMIEDVYEGQAMGERFLYYQAKTAGSYGKVKREIELPEYRALRADCLRIYDLFLPVDYGTFDIRLDGEGRHYFLEFNADATLHPRRTLAQCCALHGVDYREMMRRILKSAFQRWGIQWK